MSVRVFYGFAALLIVVGFVVFMVAAGGSPAGVLILFSPFVAAGFIVVFGMIFGPPPGVRPPRS